MRVVHGESLIHKEDVKAENRSIVRRDLAKKRDRLVRGIPPLSMDAVPDHLTKDEYCQKQFDMSYDEFQYRREAALKCKRENPSFSFRHRRSKLGWYLVIGCYMMLAATLMILVF